MVQKAARHTGTYWRRTFDKLRGRPSNPLRGASDEGRWREMRRTSEFGHETDAESASRLVDRKSAAIGGPPKLGGVG